MAVIGVKSITGITSITNAAGGADVLTFHSNNTTERVRIASNGRVGIGTVTPNALLDVYSSTAATDKDLLIVRSITGGFAVRCSDISASNPTWALRTYSNEDIIFSPGNVEKLRIESGGNIGIGTDNPNNKLHVYGGIIKSQSNPTNTGTNVELIRAQSGSGGGAVFTIRAENAADDNSNWDFKTNANEDLTFTIGSANETLRISGTKTLFGHTASVGSGKLQVFTKVADALDILSFDDTAADGGRITFYRNKNTTYGSNTKVAENDSLGRIDFRGMNTEGTDNYEVGASIQSFVDAEPGSGSDANDMPGRLIFLTTPDGSHTAEERLRITSAGRVGIGTEDPQGILDITGNRQGTSIDMDGAFKQDGSMNWNFAQHQWIRSASNTNDTKIVSILAAGDNAADTNLYNNINFLARTSSNFGAASTSRGIGVSLEITSPNDIRFGTNTTERLRLHSDGKLSLGTSSSASSKFNISHGNELALYTSGPYNYQAKFESTDAEAAIVIEDSNSGTNYNRIGVITNDMTFITNNNERVRINSAGTVHISEQDNYNNTAIVQLQDNLIGGIRVAVNDETISAAITMPRKGGMLCLTCFSTYDTYVQPQPSGFVYVDAGPSKRVDVLDVGSPVATGVVGKTTYTSNVSDCDNGKLTVMIGQTDGTIHLVNRYHDWDAVWTITFL